MSRPQKHQIEMGTVPPLHQSSPSSSSLPPSPAVAAPAPQQETTNRLYAGWGATENDVLLVVATLITALSYQLGTNIPGGFWQDDGHGHSAGDPIMRDKHRRRYWLFMTGSWTGFGSSMLMTVCLLTGVPAKACRVRWSFIVSYSSLVLTFVTSQPQTSLVMDIGIWIGVLVCLFVGTHHCHKRSRLCCSPCC